jgi:hypothetical protein
LFLLLWQERNSSHGILQEETCPLLWADLMLNQMNPKLSIDQTQKYFHAGASYADNAPMC